MTTPPRPENDTERVEALRRFAALDTAPEASFDRLTRRAAVLFDAPVAAISLMDKERHWIKSCYGAELREQEATRGITFCGYTILSNEPLVVPDALEDERFASHPSVAGGSRIRFYAGAPLITSDGFRIGSLCVIDREPRPAPEPAKLRDLQELAAEVVEQLEHRKIRHDLAVLNRELEERNQELEAQARRLRKTELWASLALESGRMGYWQFDCKTGERFWSPPMYEIFGRLPAEGPPSTEKITETIHPEDRPAFARIHARILEGFEPEDYDFRITVPGQEVRWLSARGKLIVGPDGEPESLCGVTWEVTDRRRAEETLRKNEEMFRALNFACPVGIFRAAMDGAVEYVNPRYNQICGLEEGEALGFGFRKRVHPKDLKRAMREFVRSVRERREVQIDFRLLLPDGSVRWVHVRAVPVGQAEQAYLVGTIEDVTFAYLDAEELRQAKNAAEKADRAKSDFLANMSHEIRTPLNGVLAAMSLLLDSPLTPEQRELVEIAQGSGAGLLQLLSDILDLTKAELGILTTDRLPFDLKQTVSEAVGAFSQKAKEKGLSIEVSMDPAAPEKAVGDVARIRQILLNFMSNAVKFTERGQIGVSVTAVAGDMVRIAVSDTGIGIPEHARDCLFVRFAQADTSSTRRFGGTGLGLAICKQLAELMGGSVGFESEEGRGSRFWVDLSLAPAFVY